LLPGVLAAPVNASQEQDETNNTLLLNYGASGASFVVHETVTSRTLVQIHGTDQPEITSLTVHTSGALTVRSRPRDFSEAV
jgi:hypothetical protein